MYTPISPSLDDQILTVKAAGPYAYFLTLPVLKPKGGSVLSLPQSVDAFNQVAKCINRYIFGSKAKKRGEHITGYCCIEDHKLDGYHFHALIKRDPAFFVEGKPYFGEHFKKAALTLQRYNPIKENYQTYKLTAPDHLQCRYIKQDETVNQLQVFDEEVHDDARYVIKEHRKPLIHNNKRYERWYFIERGGIKLTDKF